MSQDHTRSHHSKVCNVAVMCITQASFMNNINYTHGKLREYHVNLLHFGFYSQNLLRRSTVYDLQISIVNNVHSTVLHRLSKLIICNLWLHDDLHDIQ